MALSAALSACTHTAHIRTDDTPREQSFPPTKPESIKVFTTNDAPQHYAILGVVMAAKDVGEDAESVLAELREEAAKMGADAVVAANLVGSQGYWEHGFVVDGIAVKYKK